MSRYRGGGPADNGDGDKVWVCMLRINITQLCSFCMWVCSVYWVGSLLFLGRRFGRRRRRRRPSSSWLLS
jgi:hypothetical protein